MCVELRAQRRRCGPRRAASRPRRRPAPASSRLDVVQRSGGAARCAAPGCCAWCAARLSWAGEPSVVKPARASVRRLQVLELGLDQVGQLQVLEEQVEEFVLGQREDEIVLALAVGAALAAATAAAALRRLADLVADRELLVAGQHEVALRRCRGRGRNDGSRRLFERMVIFSRALRPPRSCASSAPRGPPRGSRALARRRKRWRLPRLLAFGLRRRSTICIPRWSRSAR